MVGDAWRDWPAAMAQDFTSDIYASFPLTAQTVAATDAYIASAEPHAALNRLLSEGRDDVLRALRCQEHDRQAG
jgi:aminopeptidase N